MHISLSFFLSLFFNGISTFVGYFNAKAILQEEQLWWYYLTYSWDDKGVHTFPKGICLKVNIIARLEYELAYYDSAVYRFNHYTMRIHTPPHPTPSIIEKQEKFWYPELGSILVNKTFLDIGKIRSKIVLHWVTFTELLNWTINLEKEKYKPSRKYNSLPVYINTSSYNTPLEFRQVLPLLSYRLSVNSSNKSFNRPK